MGKYLIIPSKKEMSELKAFSITKALEILPADYCHTEKGNEKEIQITLFTIFSTVAFFR